MRFEVTDEIWAAFPRMRIVLATARGVDNTVEREGIGHALTGAWEAAGSLGDEHPNAQSHPHVRPWREAFSALGVSGNRFPTSIEALLRRAMKGGTPPRINPLVDLYNAISLDHVVPVGGFDLAALGGHLRLGVTGGGESFLALDASEPVEVPAGEVAYMTGTSVLTRHLAWRQSKDALLSPGSADVLLLSEIVGPLPDELAARVAEAFAGALHDHFGVTARTEVLDASNAAITLAND